MRFLCDMGVSKRVVDWLREQGHDASHLSEEGLQRLPDGDIFDKAFKEGRVILSFDLDFGAIVALTEGRVVSVVLFRLHNARADFVIQRLSAALLHTASALEHGAIVVVEDARFRVRYLPIGRERGEP